MDDQVGVEIEEFQGFSDSSSTEDAISMPIKFYGLECIGDHSPVFVYPETTAGDVKNEIDSQLREYYDEYYRWLKDRVIELDCVIQDKGNIWHVFANPEEDFAHLLHENGDPRTIHVTWDVVPLSDEEMSNNIPPQRRPQLYAAWNAAGRAHELPVFVYPPEERPGVGTA